MGRDNWLPPMKNCGLCGEQSCMDLLEKVRLNEKLIQGCPYYKNTEDAYHCSVANFSNIDTHGYEFDLVLEPFPNEISVRKIVKPFRTDLIDILDIKSGCYVMGRPMGAGCPVTHVLQVYDVNKLAGVLYTWVVGPKISREHEVIDISAYYMVGFEGLATHIKEIPKVGKKAGFMPGFCMLRLTHYGLVNLVMETKDGLHVRIEDIHIAN